MKKGESKRGFTVIEVVLVLAVAGLIFVMVFVALPALQRSQRDNTRRDDLMNFISKVKKYQTSNRGALPGSADKGETYVDVEWSEELKNSTGNANTWRGFYRDYLGDFIEPDGEYYKLTVMECGGQEDTECDATKDPNQYLEKLPTTNFGTEEPPNDYRILVVLQAKCKGTEVVGSSNPRNLAVLYRLEGSGAYCFGT